MLRKCSGRSPCRGVFTAVEHIEGSVLHSIPHSSLAHQGFVMYLRGTWERGSQGKGWYVTCSFPLEVAIPCPPLTPSEEK